MLKYSLFIILIFNSILSFTQLDSAVHTEKVSSQYILDCELGISCNPIEIVRNSLDEKISLALPNSGNNSAVYLLKNIDSDPLQKIYGSLNEKKEELIFDLSTLPDDSYLIQYMSCNLGGTFTLKIITRQ